MESPNLVVGNSHVLQGRSQNYVIVRRLLTLHSEDRDACKWPSSSHFEVELPEPITNVQSMRLVNLTLPQNLYVFSRTMQNTKMWVSDQTSPVGDMVELEIQEGTYTADQLALELQCRLIGIGYTGAEVLFDKVSLRFWFRFRAESRARPVFHFDFPHEYAITQAHPNNPNPVLSTPGCTRPCWGHSVEQSPLLWNGCAKWGLGWYLGFDEKVAVVSQPAPAGGLVFGWRAECTDDCTAAQSDASTAAVCAAWAEAGDFYIAAPCPASTRILGDTAIYVDIDKYNMYDELSPQTTSSTSMFHQKGGGTVNAAFAKVAITSAFGTRIIDPDQQGFQNVQQFDPPLERIQKLKFKIRYHDGRLVDLKGAPFDISMEFNQLRDEIKRNYTVRIPPLYH